MGVTYLLSWDVALRTEERRQTTKKMCGIFQHVDSCLRTDVLSHLVAAPQGCNANQQLLELIYGYNPVPYCKLHMIRKIICHLSVTVQVTQNFI